MFRIPYIAAGGTMASDILREDDWNPTDWGPTQMRRSPRYTGIRCPMLAHNTWNADYDT